MLYGPIFWGGKCPYTIPTPLQPTLTDFNPIQPTVIRKFHSLPTSTNAGRRFFCKILRKTFSSKNFCFRNFFIENIFLEIFFWKFVFRFFFEFLFQNFFRNFFSDFRNIFLKNFKKNFPRKRFLKKIF